MGGGAREPAAVDLADAIDAAAAASAACFCCSGAVIEVFGGLPGTCAAATAVVALNEEMLSMLTPEGDGEDGSHRSGTPGDSLNSSCNC